MFAVYWLMRIGIDGELGFSFGVDEHWAPRPPCPPTITPSGAQLKRQTFYEKQEWRKLQDLLVDAQMLHRKEDDEVEVSGIRAAISECRGCWQRFPAEAAHGRCAVSADPHPGAHFVRWISSARWHCWPSLHSTTS